jgi:hypothetical protein
MDLYEPTKLVADIHNAAESSDPVDFESCWTALHQTLKESELEPALVAELLLGPRASVFEILKLTLTFATHGRLPRREMHKAPSVGTCGLRHSVKDVK